MSKENQCHFQTEKEQKQNYESIYVQKLVLKLLQSYANNFFDTRQSFQGEIGLNISEVKLRKNYILLTKQDKKIFEDNIKGNLQNYLDEIFLSIFIELVEKRIDLIQKSSNFNDYQRYILVLSKKEKSDSPYRPTFLRLDYLIVQQKIEYPSLKEVFLLSYTLSSIKKQIFRDQEIESYINVGYQILNCLPNNQKATTQILIDRIRDSRELSIKENTLLYKGQQIKQLIQNQKKDQNPQRGLSYYPKEELSKISLLIVHTTWADGSEYYGTAFLYSHQAAITSTFNVAQRDGIKVQRVRVYLNPTSNISWAQINPSKIVSFLSFSVIVLPIKLERRAIVQVIDYSDKLPQYVSCIYVFGYYFTKENKETLSYKTTLDSIAIKGKPSFESYFAIKSKASIGSLVLFVSNYKVKVFGIYNPLNEGSLNFNLFHGSVSQEIDIAIQNTLRNGMQSQGVIGPDDRTEVPPSKLQQLPYSAIGMIYSFSRIYDLNGNLKGQNNVQGTGTFITPNLIITCAHNVLARYPKDLSYNLQGSTISTQIRFYPGLSTRTANSSLISVTLFGNYPFYLIKSQDIYVTQSYKNDYLPNKPGRINGDIAVIHLKNHSPHPAFLSIKSVPKTDKIFWETNTLTICGYPAQTYGKMRQSSGKGIIDQDMNRIAGIDNMLSYQIDTTQGNSGSAVMAKDKEGNYEVVAIHTQGSSDINLGPLLVGDNLAFVQEKINTLGKGKKSLTSSLKELQTNNSRK